MYFPLPLGFTLIQSSKSLTAVITATFLFQVIHASKVIPDVDTSIPSHLEEIKIASSPADAKSASVREDDDESSCFDQAPGLWWCSSAAEAGGCRAEMAAANADDIRRAAYVLAM